jgi:hypothetical protein
MQRFPGFGRTTSWLTLAMRVVIVGCCLRAAPIPAIAAPPADLPTSAWKWAGKGRVRIIVRIDPDGSPAGDERPAEVSLDFDKLLATAASGRQANLAGVQVIRHDAATGEPVPQTRNAFGEGEFDNPLRWYDAAIPYDFPEVEANVSSTEGKLPYVTHPRLGYFFDCLGDWKAGRLAFMYRSIDRPAWYAVYFDLLPPGAIPRDSPPRGFLGDGLQRCEPRGSSSTGLIHSRVTIADLNGDGLFDLVVGCSRGGVVWYPNRGCRGQPDFPHAQLVFSDDKPLDVGWGAAPHAVDWDGDFLVDFVVGAERNRLLWYRNQGSKAQPRFEYAGLVTTDDGRPLALPVEPVPEGPDVYKLDYYPVVETVDWDGDGDFDLLAGGFITGRIYLYENLAAAGREPKLRFVGPIEADGKPLDVGWAAAPTVADLDADGDWDLISGCMPMTAGGGDSASSEHFLHYFRNDGDRKAARLHEIAFPREGSFPNAALASPRLVDWSDDGLLDLVVSSGTQIYLYRNIGTAREPRFEVHANVLPSRWGAVPLGLVQMLDWNGDGLLDGANGPNIYLNTGRGSPGVFASPVSLLKPGQTIGHLSGIGDDWQFQRLFDLDADGRIDLMDADHAGRIWWHRNTRSNKEPDFDTRGTQLVQTDGRPVQVGLDLEGFDKLQGARATYTVGDFDADGRPDLVVVDTLGIVRYFRQARPVPNPVPPIPVFDPPLQLGKLPIRGVPYAADWDGDGRLDVVAGSDAQHVVAFINRSPSDRASPFEPALAIPLPQAPYGAGAPIVVADYNGDGDTDLVIHTAYGYTCFYERSFIRSGYAKAAVVDVQQCPK